VGGALRSGWCGRTGGKIVRINGTAAETLIAAIDKRRWGEVGLFCCGGSGWP
jgi:hypothetical protein